MCNGNVARTNTNSFVYIASSSTQIVQNVLDRIIFIWNI
nr:MAG TPA: hypothetical protein [Caudoviricetes sp.]